MFKLTDILEIENDEEILRFKCPETGYLLWPLIRNAFLRYIISDMFYDKPLISEQRPHHSWKSYTSVLKACAYNMLKGSELKGAVLISASGSHFLLDDRYFNRLSDYFALAEQERTVTLEALFTDWHWPFPRYNEKVLFDTSILALSSMFGKINMREKHRKIAKSLVDFVAIRAWHLLGWQLSEQRNRLLTISLAKHIASIPIQKHLYSCLFERMGARILIREEGCYSSSAVVNSIAHECGVITAEYQHGAVSAGHDAYNLAETLRTSAAYKNYIPQYFLAYGKWWADQINVPTVKLIIGNPDRTESLKNLFHSHRKKTDLIILGDGIETDMYLNLCSALAQDPGVNKRVVFRPHPLERELVLRKYGKNVGTVAIEWDKGICEAFETADTVVSELSTGLFEAVGLVNRIFLWDTPKANFCFPSHPFAVFHDAEDLVVKIRDGDSGRIDLDLAEKFWAPNWKQNYLSFLENVCPGILNVS